MAGPSQPTKKKKFFDREEKTCPKKTGPFVSPSKKGKRRKKEFPRGNYGSVSEIIFGVFLWVGKGGTKRRTSCNVWTNYLTVFGPIFFVWQKFKTRNQLRHIYDANFMKPINRRSLLIATLIKKTGLRKKMKKNPSPQNGWRAPRKCPQMNKREKTGPIFYSFVRKIHSDSSCYENVGGIS